MGLWDGHYAADVAGSWLDSVLANGVVHVGSVSLQQFHGTEGGQVFG